jgi:hypothetical protein
MFLYPIDGTDSERVEQQIRYMVATLFDCKMFHRLAPVAWERFNRWILNHGQISTYYSEKKLQEYDQSQDRMSLLPSPARVTTLL